MYTTQYSMSFMKINERLILVRLTVKKYYTDITSTYINLWFVVWSVQNKSSFEICNDFTFTSTEKKNCFDILTDFLETILLLMSLI